MDNPVSQQPRLDMYAQDLLRQSYQTNPISSDVLNQYGQGMDQQVVQPPAIQNYAPQQYQQAPQQFQQQNQMSQQMPEQNVEEPMLQPSKRRIAYNQLIQDRFDELANKYGGIENLKKTGNIELAQKKAAADIASYYGGPPDIEKPMSEMERVQLEEAQIKLAKLKNPTPEQSDFVKHVATNLGTYLTKTDPMIGQIETIIETAENPDIPLNEKLATAKLVGKLMNSVMVGTSDAVSQDEAAVLLSEVNEKIKPEGLWTSATMFGTDLPQFVAKLKNLRDSVSKEYNKSVDMAYKIDPESKKLFEKRVLYRQPKGQSTGQPQAQGMPQGQPAAPNEPMRITSPGATQFVRDSTGKLIRQQ